ncbi:MAG TPA: transporter [Candidatus Methylomirabilis sp.]|nr:transporter [Candidatus Methylomirabilis sp.]
MAAFALASSSGSAPAFEPGAHIPYLAGSAGGVPIGVVPPPGWYLSSLTTYVQGTFHADIQPKQPMGLSLFSEGLTLLWVPEPEILGARYSAYVSQAAVVKTISNIPPRDVTRTETGLINTVISPVNLGWTLPDDFYVSGRFTFYPKDGQYSSDNLVNIANNFWTFEPNVGISYLKGGFDLSIHLIYDIVTENTNTLVHGNVHGHYQSGNVFVAEYSLSQAFGPWRFGMTGYGVQQTNDDSAGGRTLHNTELSKVGAGPLVEYNAKWIGINLYYIRDIAWRRAFGGNNVFFKITVKF